MGMRVLLRRGARRERSTQRPRSALRSQAAALTLCVSAAVLAVIPSAGAGVLDQSQPTLSGVSAAVSDIQQDAQTFTNGITGSLDQVDLALGKVAAANLPLTVEIRTVSSGVPAGAALATETVSAASIPAGSPNAFVSVPLAPPASVTAGVQYAIVLKSSCGSEFCYLWALGPQVDPYLAGSALWRPNAAAAWVRLVDEDFAFKTYVGPPVVRPTTKNQCKKGGWRRFTNPSFKNQGQCVAYVNHQGKDYKHGRGKRKGGGRKN
jgi:hypothetical protein